MAAKKSGTAARSKSQTTKQGKSTGKASDATKRIVENDEGSGGSNLGLHAQLNGKYLQFESIEERRKEVERVRRAIYANLMRIAIGMANTAASGSNAGGAKVLFEFAGIDELPELGETQAETTQPAPDAGAAAANVAADELDDDPTKAVLSFYKKLGMTPPRLKPLKAVETVDTGNETLAPV